MFAEVILDIAGITLGKGTISYQQTNLRHIKLWQDVVNIPWKKLEK